MACSKEIFDTYIMKELLACSHVSAPDPLPSHSDLEVGTGGRDSAKSSKSSQPPLSSPALLKKCH